MAPMHFVNTELVFMPSVLSRSAKFLLKDYSVSIFDSVD